MITERYFFPRRVPLPDALEVRAASGDTLACFHDRVEGSDLTVVHLHGNGEVVADNLGLLPFLRGLGVSTLLAEYRGYGASTGSPALGAMLDDVDALLEATGRPPRDVVLFGRSVGSLYALEAVARYPEVAGLILESGIADVLERLAIRLEARELGVSPEDLRAAVRERLDHEAKLRAYPGPVLIMHTEDDDLVDVSHAQRNHRWAGEGARLVLFPHGGHNGILLANHEEYWSAIRELLEGVRSSPGVAP